MTAVRPRPCREEVTEESSFAEMPRPTVTHEDAVADAFRAQVLSDLDPEGMYSRYCQEQDPRRRKELFALAVWETQLTLAGVQFPANEPVPIAVVRKGVLTRLARVYWTLSANEMSVFAEWSAKASRSLQSLHDDEADSVSQMGFAFAPKLIAEHSPDGVKKSGAFPTDRYEVRAGRLLELAEALLVERGWPSTILLYHAEASGGLTGRYGCVQRFLGYESPENRDWNAMTDRQRCMAIQKALLECFRSCRALARGDATIAQWNSRYGPLPIPLKALVLAAVGRQGWADYKAADETEQDRIVASSVAILFAWSHMFLLSL